MHRTLALIRTVVAIVCAGGVLIFGAGWAQAMRALPSVQITAVVQPRTTVADGQHTVHLAVRVTQDGHPRAGDIVDAIGLDGGNMIPPEGGTDRQGRVTFAYIVPTSNAYQTVTVAHVEIRDISIGALVEVDKVIRIGIPLKQPPSS